MLLATTLLQYFIFQYSHFSLSEIPAVTCAFAGIYFLFRHFSHQQTWAAKRSGNILAASFFFSAAYYFKIQFIYLMAIVPLSLIILDYKNLNTIKKMVAPNYFLMANLAVLFFAALYFVAWYLPFKSTFDFVLADESAGKFASLTGLPATTAFNIIHSLFSAQAWWFNTLVIICFALGIFIYRKGSNRNFRILFVLSTLWVIVECSKLTMLYLPSRYLVGYYFAAGFMCSVVVLELHAQKQLVGRTGLAIMLLFVTANGIQYAQVFERRAFSIQAINNYFSSAIKNSSRPVMGPWSPSSTWDCRARCIPVWKNFMNDKDLFNRFHPQAIISEPNESESNGAYSSQGIDLKQLSDSSRNFHLGRWEVTVYWMK